MAKNQEIEFDTTANNNTDAGGIGIQGTNLPSNFDNALRYLMKARADAITRRVVKASASGPYTAAKTDHNQFWDVTGTTACTINLTAAATLTTGWCLYVKANGAAVTLDGNASETIDGSATLVIPGGASCLIVCDGSNFFTLYNTGALSALGSGILTDYRSPNGLVCTNDSGDLTNDIAISAGTARDSTDTYSIYLSSSIVKRLDAAWAVGTGNGGIDTGAAANTTYFIWLIRRPDTGVVDALLSTSSSSPTMPANYTQKALIGAFGRISAANTLPRSYSVPYTDWTSYTPTFTGFGTESSVTFKFQRIAGTCNIYGRFVSGTTTATEARITLPARVYHTGNSIDFAGMVAQGAAAANTMTVLVENQIQYMTFGIQNVGNAGLTKVNASTGFANSTTYALQCSFQAYGW